MKSYLSLFKVPFWHLRKILNWNFPKNKVDLEIQVADHCNLNCAGCSHYSSISPTKFISIDSLSNSLSLLSKYEEYFRIIRIMGGEPLLNPDIIKIMEITRSHFPEKGVIIVTNGILLKNDKICDNRFWESLKKYNIDLCITLYPNSITIEDLERISINKNMKFIIYGDRTIKESFFIYRLNENKKGKLNNYYRCNSGCFQLVGSRLYACPQMAYVDKLNKKFGVKFKILKRDFFDITKISRIKFLLYINLPKPFCKYCVFPRKTTDWKITEYKMEEWIEK